jgi:hypothetical protein
MQAQFAIRRSPAFLVSVLFAVAAVLLLGGTLGYLLKPASFVSGPARVVVVSTSSGSATATDDLCIWTANPRQKDC